MNKKGSDILAMRKLLNERNPESEKQMLSRLSSRTTEHYARATANSWMPDECFFEIARETARELYPGHPHSLKQLGSETSQVQFTGIYKVFLKMASIAFIVKRAAQIWKSFNDQGDAVTENMTAHSGDLVIRGLNVMPVEVHEYTHGYICRLLELAGAKNVAIRDVPGTPDVWRMSTSWE